MGYTHKVANKRRRDRTQKPGLAWGYGYRNQDHALRHWQCSVPSPTLLYLYLLMGNGSRRARDPTAQTDTYGGGTCKDYWFVQSHMPISRRSQPTFVRLGLIDIRDSPGSADAEPPLSALIYAVQGILYPTLSFGHIPDLLDILSQVERVRQFLLEHARWALIWQRFYETRPNPNIRVLQKSDKDVLKKVLKPERLDATRRIFICIVEHIIRMVRILVPSLLCFGFSALLICGSMCFICGRTPRNRIAYTTTSEFTFPGPMGNPTAKAFIMHR